MRKSGNWGKLFDRCDVDYSVDRKNIKPSDRHYSAPDPTNNISTIKSINGGKIVSLLKVFDHR